MFYRRLRLANRSRLFLLTLLITVAPKISFAREILFSSQVNPQETIQILQDLNSDLTLVKGKELKKVMGVPNLEDRTLKNWLSERVGYIVGEDEDPVEHLVELQGNYEYQNPHIFPNFEKLEAPVRQQQPPSHSEAAPQPSRQVIFMNNIGTSFYYMGKSKDILVGYQFDSQEGRQTIAINSPRTGIIKVGEGLFETLLDPNHPTSMVNKWFRLENLFHEAHHSDGNGTSLGFPHAVCPVGHKYYNLAACDRSGNGPYAISALFMEQARRTCVKQNTCTAGEAALMGVAVLDARSRILNKNFIDSRPEGRVVSGGTTPGL